MKCCSAGGPTDSTPSLTPHFSMAGGGGGGATWLRPVTISQAHQHTKLAATCYFLLGSGILAPWNALITAADYYEQIYPGRHMDRLFTICYLPVCLLLLGVVIKFNTMPARPRILTSFALFTLLMLGLPLVDSLMVGNRDAGPDSALAVLLLVVVIVGVLDGLSQGAIFGDAADLPPAYTHAVVGGTASSGVIICFLRIITKAALPPTRAGLRSSTAVYFALSGLLSLACFVVYHSVLPRLGVVQYYKQKQQEAALELSPQPSLLEAEGALHSLHDDDQRPLVRPDDPISSSASSSCLHQSSSGLHLQHPNRKQSPRHALAEHSPSRHAAAAADTDVAVSLAAVPKQRLSWQHVLSEAWQSILALFLVYVVTLSLFPGVLAEDLKSAVFGDWYPVFLITLFNCCDLTGKCVPFGSLAPTPRVLLSASASRSVFIPAFYVAGRYAGSWVWLMALLTAALGLSNGLLTALLMTLAPQSVEGREAGLVENMLVFSLVAGLTVGATAGWLWLL